MGECVVPVRSWKAHQKRWREYRDVLNSKVDDNILDMFVQKPITKVDCDIPFVERIRQAMRELERLTGHKSIAVPPELWTTKLKSRMTHVVKVALVVREGQLSLSGTAAEIERFWDAVDFRGLPGLVS